MLNKTKMSNKQNISTLVYKIPIPMENKGKKPYLRTVEDGLRKMKEEENHSSPSFAFYTKSAPTLA